MTVAQLLTTQIPKLLASKSDVQPRIGAADAFEAPIAEGANAWRPMSTHAVVVPLRAMPTGERGNLVARTNANGRLSAIVLEVLYDVSGQAPLLPLQNLDLLAPDQIPGSGYGFTTTTRVEHPRAVESRRATAPPSRRALHQRQ